MRLAIDLGAESGRLVLGRLGDDGRLHVRETHRFATRTVPIRERVHWDFTGLWRHVLDALADLSARHIAPASVGIDAWGVDFGLLGARGELVGLPGSYRDPSGAAALRAFAARDDIAVLYERTGIQVLSINTIFQLAALASAGSDALATAHHMLFLPDLLAYLLTGTRRTEWTMATTSGLIDARTRSWASDLFEAIGVRPCLAQEIVPPGTRLGEIDGAAAREAGMRGISVIAVASHDTASAVAAVPAADASFAYVSSGTWSLVGVEADAPVLTRAAFAANMTNEGGLAGRTRVLRNVTGLWLLERCRRAWAPNRSWTFEDLEQLAARSPALRSLIDPDGPFDADEDMPSQIAEACMRTGQVIPETEGAVARCIFDSLALATHEVLADLRRVTGRDVRTVHVVGGGSRNALLCQATADATGLPVLAGPAEATAIGNLLVQCMAAGELAGIDDLREVVRASFPPLPYTPDSSGESGRWDEALERFRGLRRDPRETEP